MKCSIIRRLSLLSLLGASLWLSGCVVPGNYSNGATVYVPTPIIVPQTVYVPRYYPRTVYVPRYYPHYPVRGYYPQSGLRVR
jgi:hypothetical protein